MVFFKPAILLKIHTDQTENLEIKQICIHGKLLRHWQQPGSAEQGRRGRREIQGQAPLRPKRDLQEP